jgi:hypothetical protein
MLFALFWQLARILVWKEEGINPIYLNEKEKGERYNLYVNKCQVLKIIDLLKMSFRINLKCNVHNILISILHAHCNN